MFSWRIGNRDGIIDPRTPDIRTLFGVDPDIYPRHMRNELRFHSFDRLLQEEESVCTKGGTTVHVETPSRIRT